MDALADLKARALKAREFTHTVGERCYTLRVPTRQEVRQKLHERRLLDSGGSVMALQLLQHALLLDAVVGWAGVRERDAVPGGGADPLPWSAETVPLVLDELPDEADALGVELFARTNLRNAAIEGDAKN